MSCINNDINAACDSTSPKVYVSDVSPKPPHLCMVKKKDYQHKYLESHHQGYLHACVSNNEIICYFISLAGAKDAISKSWSLLM